MEKDMEKVVGGSWEVNCKAELEGSVRGKVERAGLFSLD
jgi:hypothetical protein